MGRPSRVPAVALPAAIWCAAGRVNASIAWARRRRGSGGVTFVAWAGFCVSALTGVKYACQGGSLGCAS